MTNYYVRIGGSDAAAGTSAGAAWRTIGKALGASGIASGDTVYVGAGVYREAVTVAMTSATVNTNVIGDITGEFTGDGGEVIWTNYINGWQMTATGSPVLTLSDRDFLTFQNLTILAGGANSAVSASVTSQDIVFRNCYIACSGAATAVVGITANFGIALNWTIDRCLIWGMATTAVSIIQTTGVGSDWDLNVTISDSVILSTSSCIIVTNSGTSANEGGGVDVRRCTLIGATGLNLSGSRNSLNFPSTIQDTLSLALSGYVSGEAGALTDLGGNVTNGTTTNATFHASSRSSAHHFPAPFLSLGHEWMWGMEPRRTYSPFIFGQASGGHIGSATTDMEQRARPEGISKIVDSGTATAGAATTITDTGKAWKTNEHAGRRIRTTGGTGPGQVKHIASNTATVLTIGTNSGDWATTPASGTTYIIYDGPLAETGKATAGAASTMTDSGAAWSTNQWAGYTLAITGGTGSGQTATLVSNTGTVLVRSGTWGTNPASGSIYEIYWPGTSLTAPLATPGALEMHDTALRETTTTDAGSVGIVLNGPASHEFRIPVDASSTTITVKAQYDANHGTTNKPQAILLANGEIGVATETQTMTSGSGTWDTLTFSSFTPTAKGVVTVRLVSRSETPYGRAYFDTWTVS